MRLVLNEISGYKIVREIGHGGMSTVYLAVQKSVNRYVALKVMSSHLVDDESYTKRFLSEARIAARFRHPNIIAIFDVNIFDGIPYIAMEYVPGGELDTERIKSMNLTEKLSVLVQIADALGFLHKQNFVHRDIKPANILFREDNTVVLTDFGVARDQTASTHETLTGYIIGTPHYLSPEQAQGRTVDARSDLYSLGIMMFRVLTSRLPYVADDAISICTMHVHANIPDLPKEYKKFDRIIKKAMAKSPEDRHQSAYEFIDDLISVTGSKTAKLLRRSVEGVALEAIKSEDADTTTRAQVQVTEADLRTKIQPSIPTVSLIHRKIRRFLGLDLGQKAVQAKAGSRKPLHRRLVLGGLVVVLVTATALILIPAIEKKADEDSSAEEERIDEPAPAPVPTETTELTMESEPEPEPGPEPVQEDFYLDIDALLSRGFEALEQGIYVQPMEVSALGYFREVLSLEPNNAQAQAGLESLAGALLDLMEAELLKGELDVAEQFLEEAKQTQSADPARLARLENILKGKGDTAKSLDSEIAEKLSRGYEYLAVDQLTLPADANAVSEFNQVLLMDEGNAKAMLGLEQVGIRYLVLAKDHMSSGNWSQAEAYWQNSNKFAPRAPDSAEVRKLIDDHEAARSARQPESQAPAPPANTARVPDREIVPYQLPSLTLTGNESPDALYKQAEQAKKSGNKMLAYAFYKAVVRSDPDFGHAQRRLYSGAGSYINVASRDILKGELFSARENLSKASALDASHPKFSPVRRDYLTAIDNATNASTAQNQSTSIADIQIKSIMEKAEQYHSRFEMDSANRLAASNAQETYREVLAMRSDYQAARDGLNRLFHDYLGAARQALSQSRKDDAAWFLGKAREISPGHPDLLALESQLD
jgi:serine/threonine-protein kinase PpkA